MALKRRRSSESNDLSSLIWPGFVDALAALLMVIVFVLMVFILSQFYLSDALNEKSKDIEGLNKTVETLSLDYKKEQQNKQSLLSEINDLQKNMQNTRGVHENEKLQWNDALNELKIKVDELSQSLVKAMEDKNKLDNTLLENQKQADDDLLIKDVEIDDLKSNLDKLQMNIDTLETMQAYRSEFFGKLKKAFANNPHVKITGDRFRIQSEVLFPQGSAVLGDLGKTELQGLISVLKTLIPQIPSDIDWVLRIDGHTDNVPIKTNQFPSNFELSSARATNVLQYLIQSGINPKYLMACGMGEFHPLTRGTSDIDLAKNRRIEFKIDQR
jgi:chemotaxis protein MotB